MKKTIVVLVGGLILGMVGVASATPYSNLVDFSSDGTYLGHTYSELTDSNSSSYFGLYTHSVDFNPNAVSVQSASLTIDYAYVDNSLIGNPPALKELYFFYDNKATPQQIGVLTGYADNFWYSQTFDLASYVAGVSGANWTIGFQFTENTLGTDKFYLDQSRLFGDYTEATIGGGNTDRAVVPEPSTFVLLGAGLLGLAAVAISRRKDN